LKKRTKLLRLTVSLHFTALPPTRSQE